MRWIQDPNPPYKLVPADEYRKAAKSAAIHDDISPFISPVDGSVIGSNTDLREHNRRHGVVQVLEYGGTVDPAARKKRDDHYQGKLSRAETRERRMAIHETINKLEQS